MIKIDILSTEKVRWTVVGYRQYFNDHSILKDLLGATPQKDLYPQMILYDIESKRSQKLNLL